METPDEDRNLTFEQVHRKYEEKVYHLILRLVGNHEDAEELTVETFVNAFRAWDRFRGDARVSTWLHQIAVNNCKERLRRRDARRMSREWAGQQGIVPVADTDSPPPAVLAAIDTLPLEFREVLLLNLVERKTYEETSQTLGISVAAVKTRLHRARRRLKALLWGDEDKPFEGEAGTGRCVPVKPSPPARPAGDARPLPADEGPPNGIWQ